MGLHWWFSGKEPNCQCRRCGFYLWVGKIPWRRKWQPTPVFLPGEYHGQRSLEGYSPRGRKKVRHNLATKPSTSVSPRRIGTTSRTFSAVPKVPAQSPAHSRCPMSICWENEWFSLDSWTVHVASVISNSGTLRAVAHKAPLAMGFSRQQYLSGLPYPPPGDLPHPTQGSNLCLLPCVSCPAGTFFTVWATGEALVELQAVLNLWCSLIICTP